MVLVPGDCGAHVYQEDQWDQLYTHVVITIDHGKETHRSFEAHNPEGQTLAVWRAKVFAAHGDRATVRPSAAPDPTDAEIF